MSNGQWKLVPVEPTREMLDAARFYREGEHTLATAYRAMLAAAPDAPSAEPVCVVNVSGDDSATVSLTRTGILPVGSTKLYALPPDAAAEIARLRVKTLEQAQDIRDLLGLKDDNTKLRAEVERLTKERDEALLIHQTDTGTASAVEALQATIAHQAERIAELEASLEIEKGQCELREEENRILFARMEAQAAALAKAKEALDEVQGLIEESAGVYGLHLNGDPSPWDELEAGGRFERLTTLPDALASLAQLDGAQAGEEGKEPRHD